MNRDTIKGNWDKIKGQMKARWGKLTDDQITRAEGNSEQIKGELAKSYGYSRDEAKREYEDFRRSLQ